MLMQTARWEMTERGVGKKTTDILCASALFEQSVRRWAPLDRLRCSGSRSSAQDGRRGEPISPRPNHFRQCMFRGGQSLRLANRGAMRR